MHVVPFQQTPSTIRTASACQAALIRRKIRGSDELVRLIAELSFGNRQDGFPIPTVPTGAH